MKKHIILLVVLSLLVVFSIMFISTREKQMSKYSEFKSPDGKYLLEVMVENTTGFPGYSGGRLGLVILKDEKDEILGEVRVEMVQLVEDPVWESDKVWVKLVFQLPLK